MNRIHRPPLESADLLPKRQCTQFRCAIRPGSSLILYGNTPSTIVRLILNDSPHRVAQFIRHGTHPLIHTTATTTLNNATPSHHRGRKRATYTPPSSSTTSSSSDSDSVSSGSSPTAGAPNDAILVSTDNDGEDPIAHPVQPDHRLLPPARIPFTGDFRGCAWNAQALFARGWHKQNNKMRQARSLLATQGLVALQETHSTEGRSRMLRLPHQCVSFYSHHA